MADTKISDLSPLASVATGDLIPTVDVSDTTQGPAGSTKRVTVANLKTGLGLPETANTAATGLTATGTTQGTALLLTAETNNVTTVPANTGVVLPAYVQAGARFVVRNFGANPLLVYPPSSTAINALANNAGFLLPVGTSMTFTWISSTLLVTTGLLIASATVAAIETQAANAAYGDLATVGPAVTLTTGTSVRVSLAAFIAKTAVSNSGYMSVAVSGATTRAANDTDAAIWASGVAGVGGSVATSLVITGLTPGTNVFTAKYHNDGGTTWSFSRRNIRVEMD